MSPRCRVNITHANIVINRPCIRLISLVKFRWVEQHWYTKMPYYCYYIIIIIIIIAVNVVVIHGW